MQRLPSILTGELTRAHAALALTSLNEQTEPYGLSLTQPQALALVAARDAALMEAGRVELGGGIAQKLILAFMGSPYLYQSDYPETLRELIAIFYEYKNETLDLMGDDELVARMEAAFDGPCQGSLELLAGRELERLARALRAGTRPSGADGQGEEEEAADDDEPDDER